MKALASAAGIRENTDSRAKDSGMCGRFNIRTNHHEFAAIFGVLRDVSVKWGPRYVIAPIRCCSQGPVMFSKIPTKSGHLIVNGGVVVADCHAVDT
jgi:hypothetical protein